MHRVVPPTLILTLVATLALVPTASACSFAAPPPEPAAFFVWDAETDASTRVELEHRGLGGTCELTNPAALDGDVLVWEDGDRVLALDTATGEDWTVVREEARSLSAGDGWVLVEDEAGEGVRAFPLDGSGEPRSVPVDTNRSVHVLLAGDQAYVVPREGESVSVYDVSAGGWIAEDRAVELPEDAYPVAADGGWLVMGFDDAAYVVNINTGETTERPEGGYWTLGIDDGYLYQAEPDDGPWVIQRAALPSGGFATYATNVTPQPLGPVEDGRVVLGAYSVANGTEGGGILAAGGLGVPGVGAVAAGLALVGVAAVRRGRREA